MSLTHPKYRADIDGLRAIAILSVIGYHAFPLWVKGEFIGVDVFFVISGFLISTIIFSNLQHGRFSFVEFYSRRIRRIFPALIVVLAASMAFGWFALFTDEYKQLGKHVAGGAGFISNIMFWNEIGYFDNAAGTKPLLHLWTLGIEEQFYIVWPLLLWAAWKQRLNWLAVTAVITALSFALNLRGVRTDAMATFYSPQTRFWELLIGSLLAYVALYREGVLTALQHNRTLRNIVSFMGFSAIAVGIALIRKEENFPGAWALLPTLGAALIIAAGPQAWLNRTILANRISVWFGLISYPLYLWHWPLLSFAQIMEGETPVRYISIAATLLSIALAWLTYMFIEKPLRFGQSGKAKTIVLFALMMAVGGAGYYIYREDGLAFRNKTLEAISKQFDPVYRENCEVLNKKHYGDDLCNQGTSKNLNPDIALIGDSHANAYASMFSAYSKINPDFPSFIQFGEGSCPALLDYGPRFCREFTKDVFHYIENNKTIKTVVLAAKWPGYYVGGNKWLTWNHYEESADSFKSAFEKTIIHLKSLDKKVIVLFMVPIESNPRACFSRPLRLTGKNNCNLTRETADHNSGDYKRYFKEKLKALDVQWFDPFDYFCDDITCKISEGNQTFSIDGSHMSPYGGEYLATKGSSELEKLFSQ